MKLFLKLIRWQNLLIIVITQVLIRYAIIKPVAGLMHIRVAATGILEPMTLQMAPVDFIILLLATLFIAAGGYVINDYFDIRTDLINRGEVIVGTRIPRRKAMMWHNILNLAGVAGGFYISYRIGYFWVGIIFLMVSGLLYFYSATYKRQFLLGNIIVSLLIATIPLMVLAYEIPVMYSHYAAIASEMPSLKILAVWVGGFALFAFITSLILEIIKDMKDFEGDKAYGSNSLPVVAGIKVSRMIVLALQVITIVMLLFTWFTFLHDRITLIYMLAAIIIPLIISIGFLLYGKTDNRLKTSAFFMKIVMLAGILYSVVVWLILEKGILS